jgi:3-phenylpropionate/trans-cinnamate dioxygenase ferredoxin reductase subunit
MAKGGRRQKSDDWMDAGPLSGLEEGKPAVFDLKGERILLVRYGEAVHAVGAECPHHGASLEEGLLHDQVLVCAAHTAAFDVSTGIVKTPPALHDLPSFDVRLVEDRIQVKKRITKFKPPELRGESGTILIIGAGAAGTAAAVALRREGFDGRVIMVTAESEPPYDRPMLSKDFLAAGFDRSSILLENDEFFTDRKIDILMGRQVSEVNHGERRIVFMDGDYLQYDRLLIATGGIPRTPAIEGTSLRNFFLLRSLSDAEAVRDAIEEARRAVVLGAGFVGLETAAVLRERDLEVHVVAPEKVPLAAVFGERIGLRLRRLHEDRGVHFHLGRTAARITGDVSVDGVVLSDESSIGADLVVAGIGILPAVHFLEETGIVQQNAVPVDARMRTAVDGIFAAGDVARIPDFITGKTRRVEHWVEAMRQGQHAARSMLGVEEEYREVPFFWSKQYDTVIRYTGHVPKVRKIVYRGDADGGDFLAGFYRGKKLLAVAGIGRTGEFISAREVIARGSTIGPRDFKRTSIDLQEYLNNRSI